MRLNIYTIFDQASGSYKRPFAAQADGEVIRIFKDMAMNAEHEIGAHPEDYSLWRIGIFDDNNAALVPEDKECLGTALEMVASQRTVDVVKQNNENAEAEILEISPGGTA